MAGRVDAPSPAVLSGEEKPPPPPLLICVDDDPRILRALERALDGEPYRLRTTPDPLQALEWVAQEPQVDMVIADQFMAPLKGTELLNRVRERAPGTLRAVLTGFPDAGWMAEAINRASVQWFVQKPWDDAGLRADLRRRLDDRRGGRQRGLRLVKESGAAGRERFKPPGSPAARRIRRGRAAARAAGGPPAASRSPARSSGPA